MTTNGTDNRLIPQIWPIFEKAYANAALAFSRMLKGDVAYSAFFTDIRAMPVTNPDLFLPVHETSCNYIVTTELLGELTGKSYLVLSHTDVLNLSNTFGLNDPNALDEFLKELDNILSAAVITILSNELKANSYGDVPLLFRDCQALKEDFSSYSGPFFVSSASLSVGASDTLHPTFLWVIDIRSLDKVTRQSSEISAP